MTRICSHLHTHFNRMKQYDFSFSLRDIPLNGIYILFEKGEQDHNTNRIVRIGTHTGKDQLPSRLKQHFINENKDRSIFRKNIGRAILNRSKDPFIKYWELDLTTRLAKELYKDRVDFDKQHEIERHVSKYIQNNLSFVVFEEYGKAKRLDLESKLISTISLCKECGPSERWLGIHSTKSKIRDSGLWQVNGLYKEPLTLREYDKLHMMNG